LFLKELEIYGFKSFAKRTKLSFNSGITAIVGPNGCGKSNITDAIRWVLGEQNIRSLRGKQLIDIVFSGNHKEKPLNMAEVSLTLNNSEKILPVVWEEINIKRRIYRSGETENFINGFPCKLKDIQEIFMNTGLSKNAYSIVAQGEIDFILSAKPSDRGYLFEEAASISKYKYEKEKILKNIEEIHNNLDKVFNIISEIKNQLVILEEEAKHLKNYKIGQEKIRDLELFLIYQKYDLYRTNLSKINKIIEKYKQDKCEIIKKIEEKELAINALNIDLMKLNREQEKYKDENYEINNRNKLYQNKLDLIAQKKIDLEKRLIYLKKEVKNISQKISTSNQNKEKVNLSVLEINQKLEDFNNKLNYLNREYIKKTKFINSINLLNNNFKKILKNLSEKESFLKEKKIKYETTLKVININLEKIKEKKKFLENQLKVLIMKENDFRNVTIKKSRNIKGIQQKLNEDKIKEIENNLKKIQLDLEKDKQSVKLKEERRDILKKILDNNILKNDNKIEMFCFKYSQEYPNNICKKLIKIIDQIPSKYEKVIEIALKESLNSIVVSNISTALNIISLLSKNELNEIKLISLDLIKKIKIFSNNQIKISDENIYGFADQIITYSQEYQELFKVLLGHVLIVKDIQSALNFSKEYLGIYKIISLDGMVIDLDGSVSIYLNSMNGQENIFYLEKEIKKLDEEIEDLHTQIIKNKNYIEKYNNIYNSWLEENNKIKKLLQQNEKENADSINNLNEIVLAIHKLKDNLKDILNEEKNILEEKRNILKKCYTFKKDHNTISEYKINIKNVMQNISIIINKRDNHINNIIKNINDVKSLILINKEKLINLSEKKEDVSSYKNEYLLELEEKKNLIEEYTKNLIKMSKNIEEFSVQIDNQSKSNTLSLKKIEQIKITVQNKSNLLKSTLPEKNNQQKLNELIKDKQHKEEILKVQYQEKYDNLEKEVNKNYNLPLEKLQFYKNVSTSQKEANQQVDILREDILKMGQINFDAESKYNNQLQRYNLLSEKYNKIGEAKKYLKILISEIDQIAMERFKETFNRVRLYFNEIFKKIFSGGEGDLILNFNKNILQSEIDIIAHPPEKKMQNIELLSSGEKALTAIALLFALWKVNPSPFCFFDEIDTSLDEINAEKLASLLKGEDLNKSQLIIITHQKSTMEAADTLYGITMEESGISKLVSVKF